LPRHWRVIDVALLQLYSTPKTRAWTWTIEAIESTIALSIVRQSMDSVLLERTDACRVDETHKTGDKSGTDWHAK